MKYIKDKRTGNLYPLRPTIRMDDDDTPNPVVAYDVNPGGYEIQGWVPRNKAELVERPRKGRKRKQEKAATK